MVNRVLRRICVPKRAEDDGLCKKIRNEKMRSFKIVLFVKHYYGKEITKFGRRT